MALVRLNSTVFVVAIAVLLSLGLGMVIGTGTLRLTTVAAGFAGCAAAGTFAAGYVRYGLAVSAVLLVGASANALPGPSVGRLFVPAAVLAPLVLAFVGRRYRSRVPAWLWWSSALLLVAWFNAVVRPLHDGAPVTATLREGLDFLVLSALVPAATAAFADRTFRNRALTGLGALAVWVALVTVGAAIGVLPASGLFAHAYQTTENSGLLRLYSIASDLPTVAAPFGLAAALLATTRRLRVAGSVVYLSALASALVELGRVKYAGFVVMTLAVLLTCANRRAFTRGALLVLAIAAAAFAAAHVGPLQQPVNASIQRASTIFDSSAQRRAYENNDTLAYREKYTADIRASLTDTQWATGLGFKPSPWFRFQPDANGMLRNSDLGWYNALNTMGLIGVLLTALPVLGVCLACWRARRRPGRDRFLVLGGLGLAAYVLTVSQTLVILYSLSGVVLLGVALGAALAVSRGPGD